MENPIKIHDLGGPPLFLETPNLEIYHFWKSCSEGLGQRGCPTTFGGTWCKSQGDKFDSNADVGWDDRFALHRWTWTSSWDRHSWVPWAYWHKTQHISWHHNITGFSYFSSPKKAYLPTSKSGWSTKPKSEICPQRWTLVPTRQSSQGSCGSSRCRIFFLAANGEKWLPWTRGNGLVNIPVPWILWVI